MESTSGFQGNREARRASFLIDYPRGDDAAIAYLAAHDSEEIGAATIVLSELYRGLMITQEMTQAEAICSNPIRRDLLNVHRQ